MSDRLVTLAWRPVEHVFIRNDWTGSAVTRTDDGAIDDVYVWRQGRADVTLRRESDAWTVVCTTVGRLRGPRQVLHAARYQQPQYAVWDVMARVIRLTHDEEQGLQAGADAAHWIRRFGIGGEGDDYVIS